MQSKEYRLRYGRKKQKNNNWEAEEEVKRVHWVIMSPAVADLLKSQMKSVQNDIQHKHIKLFYSKAIRNCETEFISRISASEDFFLSGP